MTVYFAQLGVDGPVKIGFTAGPLRRRLCTLSRGWGGKLHVLAALPENENYEHLLHGLFNLYKVRGEWFKRDGQFDYYLTNTAIPLSDHLNQVTKREREAYRRTHPFPVKR